MLAQMLSSEAAGIYGLALGLTYIFPILIGSLRAVLLPEISRLREMKEFKKYIKGSLKISFSLGMVFIPFLFFSPRIILFFFGSRYLNSIPIFNWLLLSYIALMINNPIRMALYSMNRPHLLAMVDVLKLTVMVLGCYLLIPFLGVLAPAILVLMVNVSALGFFSIYVFKQIRSGHSFSG
jgi:O-antigen/teichoic acid export membrane protein